jgi:PAS domain-containing protein
VALDSEPRERPLDENGRLKRLVGVETDITERKLYEEALFREKESAQITLQSIGDGVVTTDAEGARSVSESGRRGADRLEARRCGRRSIDEIFRGFHEETCEPVENPVRSACAAIARSNPCARRC